MYNLQVRPGCCISDPFNTNENFSAVIVCEKALPMQILSNIVGNAENIVMIKAEKGSRKDRVFCFPLLEKTLISLWRPLEIDQGSFITKAILTNIFLRPLESFSKMSFILSRSTTTNANDFFFWPLDELQITDCRKMSR